MENCAPERYTSRVLRHLRLRLGLAEHTWAGHTLLFHFDAQVLMKDIVTPVPPEEVKGVIRRCLEQAANLNYQRIKDYAKIEGNQNNFSLGRIWQ